MFKIIESPSFRFAMKGSYIDEMHVTCSHIIGGNAEERDWIEWIREQEGIIAEIFGSFYTGGLGCCSQGEKWVPSLRLYSGHDAKEILSRVQQKYTTVNPCKKNRMDEDS